MRHESITQYRFDEIMDKKQTRIRAEVMEQDSAIVPKSSKSWKYESISGSVDGVPAKTNFTIVSVNVKLKNTNEKTEETVGAMMRTNSPIAVSFEISPKSLPKDVDAFKLSCDDLYVKVRAGDKENLCIPGEKGRPAMYYKRVDTNKVFKRGELCGNNKFSAKATYRGYPLRNDGFGLYRAKFSGLGEPLTAEYEVFFDKDGVRHPSCSKCPRCPNWFYYWKDGAVPALAADDVRFSETLPAEKLGCHDNHYLVVPRSVGVRNKDVVLIAKAAAVEGTKQYPLSKTAIGNSIYPSIIVGKPEKYVGLVTTAASCAHEKMHQKVFHDLCEAANAGGVILQSLDVDGDGVIDDKELTSDSGYYFKTSIEKPDTYGFATQEPRFGEYAEYGDNEINARMAERFAYEYDIFKDWARPGCQSKKFHGPIR